MKITRLKTNNFRKFEGNFETNLFDTTYIYGGNAKGKTNILYAIIWAFLGTNLSGDEKAWLGNKNSNSCYVLINFIDNLNEEHELIRYKNKLNNTKNFITLDGVRVDNKELTKFFGNKKLMLSILNSNYFINKKPAEQKGLLENYLPKVSLTKIYNSLSEKEKKILESKPRNINLYIKELNSDMKMAEDKIKNLNGKIEYARNIVDNNKIKEKKVFEDEDKLILLQEELSFFVKDSGIGDKELLEKNVNNLISKIKEKEETLDNLLSKMKDGKKKYMEIKASNSTCNCPTCNQIISDSNKAITILNMKKDLTCKYEDSIKLKEQINELKLRAMQEKCKLHTFDGLSTKEKQNQIENIKLSIRKLEEKKDEIRNYNNKIALENENIDKAKKDIKKFKEEISSQNTLINSLKEAKKVAQKLYINFIEEKMKSVSSLLKHVTIKFYSVLRETGDIKEDFIIQYKGNDLKNLSRSEFIACSLEISNMLNKVSKINFPLFIDDSESCKDYDFVSKYSNNCQIFISEVHKGKELCIVDYFDEQENLLQAA